jgi:proline iminopeptidase
VEQVVDRLVAELIYNHLVVCYLEAAAEIIVPVTAPTTETAGPAGLYCRTVGEGPPVVVLHGGPDFDHTYLLPELDRLADSVRLVYYDQRGRGRSTGEPNEVGIASEVEDVDRVRREFGFGSVAVLGHSWGGLLAMEYAVRHPERVSHLILANTAPASAADWRALREHLLRVRAPDDVERLERIARGAPFRAGDLEAEAEYYRVHFRVAVRDPEVVDRIVARLRTHFTPERVLAARAIEERLYDDTWRTDGYDLVPRLAELDIPTLVLHGQHDLIPVALANGIAEALPRGRLVVLECGHFAYLEEPEAFSAQVAAFLGAAA